MLVSGKHLPIHVKDGVVLFPRILRVAKAQVLLFALGILLLVACQQSSDAVVLASVDNAGAAAPKSAASFESLANRFGVPTTGKANAESSEDPDEPKDYWADIPFDRSNFEEVRNFVRERYIEKLIDDSRAYSQAAAFALASDEDRIFLLVPRSFWKARRDDPDEKGLLKGKVREIREGLPYVALEEVEREEEEIQKKRLTDDEIRQLRLKDKARTRQLEDAWRQTGFSAADFDRVLAFAKAHLGKSPKWSMKKAWVSAAHGYLYSLDPHSSLIAKAAWEDSTEQITDASFEGIGAILTRRLDSDYTIVESPLTGQPAVKAGLCAGDVIVKVDGTDIKGEMLPKVVSRIRGPKGSTVILTVERVGHPKPLDIAIVRSRIDIKNVQARLVKGHEAVGYIKVTGFVPTTDDELAAAFESLGERTGSGKLAGLVLDFRNNSGGLLKQGIKVADRFLRHGGIVTVKNRIREDEVYRAANHNTWDVPLVVLVNDGSASASEIVASAFQDNNRALVIGDRTFGKASVQTLFSPLLRDDYYIKLTVARYYSPNGRAIQAVGVEPDLAVPPELDGEMPLGFREENLSNHLSKVELQEKWNPLPIFQRAMTCAKDNGRAKAIYLKNPNPAVKYDYQLMVGADLLSCMMKDRAQRKASAE